LPLVVFKYTFDKNYTLTEDVEKQSTSSQRQEKYRYMKQYGLIGYPLSHSFSKKYFSEKFELEDIVNHSYSLFPLERIDDLPLLLNSHEDLKGLNVTIPYKEYVLAFLDEIDEDAAGIGAVNTIKIVDGKLKGYNTDVYGFEIALLKLIDIDKIDNALILGTGGAAKACSYVLKKLKIPFSYVSRTKKEKQFTYEELSKQVIENHQLIINTTPLGTFPNVASYPNIPYNDLSKKHYLYDLVYNPEVTEFLKRGKEQGAAIKNGLEMLHLQAEKAWEIWNTPQSNSLH
jgi:shikimate dehydrogenase